MAFLFIEILWQSFDSFETLCTNLWYIYTKRKLKLRNENVRCLGNYTQHSHINSDGFIYTNIKCQANDIIFHINNRLYKKKLLLWTLSQNTIFITKYSKKSFEYRRK